MEQWVKDFLNQYNDKNTFTLLPLPEGNVHFQADWILQNSQMPWLELIGIKSTLCRHVGRSTITERYVCVSSR